MNMLRTLYLGGMLLCLSFAIFYPTWSGCLYQTDSFRNPTSWHRGGVFGLRGANGPYLRAPLWNPPQANSYGPETVRWPWQRPSQRHHIELFVSRIVTELSVGFIVMGVLYYGLSWVFPSGKQDTLPFLAWSVTVALIIAQICVFVLAVFSMGYAATDANVIGIISVGFLAGLGYGLTAIWRQKRRKAEGSATLSETKPTQTMRRLGLGLFWFTTGIVVGCGIAFVAGLIAASFRGPMQGVSVLGTPNYANNQTPINVATGIGILALGWATAIAFIWRKRNREFAIGLIVSTTALGIMFAIWH